MLKNYNIWPDDGNLYSQSACFVGAVELCDRVEFAIHKIKDAISEKNKKIISKRLKKGGRLDG